MTLERMNRRDFRRTALVGVLLACVLAVVIGSLDVLAFPRSAAAELEHRPIAAASLHLAIRHLPVLALAFVAGLFAFGGRNPLSGAAVALAAAPWWLYVAGITTYEGWLAQEDPLRWFVHASWYVGWPNLVSVPIGLWLAAKVRGVQQQPHVL